jgi:hypothetical protein
MSLRNYLGLQSPPFCFGEWGALAAHLEPRKLFDSPKTSVRATNAAPHMADEILVGALAGCPMPIQFSPGHRPLV